MDSINIFNNNPSLCEEYTFVVKMNLEQYYVYFDYAGYLPLDDPDPNKYINKVEGGIGKIIYAKNLNLFIKLIIKFTLPYFFKYILSPPQN